MIKKAVLLNIFIENVSVIIFLCSGILDEYKIITNSIYLK